MAIDTVEQTEPGGEPFHRSVVMVALNDGTGAFVVHGVTDVGPANSNVAPTPVLADLDGNGDLDMAIGGGGSVATLLGDGSGDFAPLRRTAIPGTQGVNHLVAADVDEDGTTDLVGFAGSSGTSGVVAYGDGAGGVTDTHEVDTGTEFRADGTTATLQVGATDLEGDGDPDFLFLASSLGVVENATDGRRPTH